jgi:hypothetical protein
MARPSPSGHCTGHLRLVWALVSRMVIGACTRACFHAFTVHESSSSLTLVVRSTSYVVGRTTLRRETLASTWCMWNAYMNFVVYCCIFPHICMLYNIISMFYIDFGDFLNNVLSFGFNSLWQNTFLLSRSYEIRKRARSESTIWKFWDK